MGSMKKALLITMIWMAVSPLFVSTARGYIHTFRPDPDISFFLPWRYYTWGIEWQVPEGEVITGATLSFHNIRHWNNRPNDLWVHLLDTADAGVEAGWDFPWWTGTHFADSDGIQLHHYQDLHGTPGNLEYLFEDNELIVLVEYLADNSFGLGFDPDSLYCNDEITLRVETDVFPSPIPPAALLFPVGLAVLVAVRRKRRRSSYNH
jgi:hypothetical protein